MHTFYNKTVFITGASRGIGKALALELAASGAKLGLMARNEAELLDVQSAVRSAGTDCLIACGDVGDEAFTDSSVRSFLDQYGQVDVLINNAGYGIFKPAEEFTAVEWDGLMSTNLKGTFLMCKAAIPHMKQRKSGHIINIASDVAKRTFPCGSLYCASKYAQDAFSSALRKELRAFGIKVSVVYSGLVDSYFHAEPQGDVSHRDWLTNEDMARSISFIAAQPPHVVIDELMIHPLAQEY